MRNLILLLTRNYHILLFLFLQGIAFFLVFQYNPYQGAAFTNFTANIAGKAYEKMDSWTSYFDLQRANDSLMAENARLRNLMYANPDTAAHPAIDTALMGLDSTTAGQYRFIPARVINNTLERRQNYLTLTAGTKHGVSGRMGVVSANGVVGIINHSSKNYSTVVSVLHQNFKLSAMIPEINEYGSITWDGKNPEIVSLNDIPLDARVAVGQQVVTSPYSKLFPKGVPVGTITEIQEESTRNFYLLKVKLSSNLRNLSHVFIIENTAKEEQELLENQNPTTN